MSNLSKALDSLGYKTIEQQIRLIQLYHASGALTDGKVPKKVLNDTEAFFFINEDKPNALQEHEDKTDKADNIFLSSYEALEWINKIGQEHRVRLRPTGTERQQMTAPQELAQHTKMICDGFEELGFLGEVVPKNPNVVALMILGASQGGILSRFNAAEKMIQEGKLHPKKIILVSGARDLWPADSSGKMSGEPSTLDIVIQRIKERSDNTPENLREKLQAEFDDGFSGTDSKNGAELVKTRDKIAKSISEKYKINWPTEADMMEYLAKQNPVLSQFDIVVVNAPKISVMRGKELVIERPNTQSTIEETVKLHGHELALGDIAVMSSQPHSKYQQGVVESVMGQKYKICMAAPGVDLNSISPEMVLVGGFEAVFASVFSSKDKAKELLRTNEEHHEATQLGASPLVSENESNLWTQAINKQRASSANQVNYPW